MWTKDVKRHLFASALAPQGRGAGGAVWGAPVGTDLGKPLAALTRSPQTPLLDTCPREQVLGREERTTPPRSDSEALQRPGRAQSRARVVPREGRGLAKEFRSVNGGFPGCSAVWFWRPHLPEEKEKGEGANAGRSSLARGG